MTSFVLSLVLVSAGIQGNTTPATGVIWLAVLSD